VLWNPYEELFVRSSGRRIGILERESLLMLRSEYAKIWIVGKQTCVSMSKRNMELERDKKRGKNKKGKSGTRI
jgi:hypothetical protein